MFLKTAQFNHEAENFSEAIGISNETSTRVREIIFFSSMANKYQKDDLYGDSEDFPPGMNKVSGDLQRAVSLITTDEEYTELLLTFRPYQKLALETMAHNRLVNDPELLNDPEILDDPKVVEKIKMLKMLQKIMKTLRSDDKVGINDLNSDTMFKRVDLVKKSNYDFNTYWSLLRATFDFDSVDDIINNALFGDQE